MLRGLVRIEATSISGSDSSGVFMESGQLTMSDVDIYSNHDAAVAGTGRVKVTSSNISDNGAGISAAMVDVSNTTIVQNSRFGIMITGLGDVRNVEVIDNGSGIVDGEYGPVFSDVSIADSLIKGNIGVGVMRVPRQFSIQRSQRACKVLSPTTWK